METIKRFLNQPAEWLKSTGPLSDIVMSSRVRLARNIGGFAFSSRLAAKQHREIIRLVETAVQDSSMLKNAIFLRSADLDEVDRQFLLERHLISREHAMEDGENAVAISLNEIVSLMVLEEDHLRLQAFQSGFNLIEAWRIVDKIDDDIEKGVSYAFSPNLGYLTACPTNVGTGLRASCMLHLPGLVLTKQAPKILQALSKLNLAVRGLYGEGTQATGNLFQFSNQITLGQHEDEIIENLECVIRKVVEHEKDARQYLAEKKKIKFEDQVWRALGALKSARSIASEEATQLISLVLLGIHMGVLASKITATEVNSLLLLVQPAHLQRMNQKVLNAAERDLKRAELIRERLKKVEV
ncbi:MAG: protein arginine kinase [Candidatus Omnitrophota bacterium]